jgi:hypothetical protein
LLRLANASLAMTFKFPAGMLEERLWRMAALNSADRDIRPTIQIKDFELRSDRLLRGFGGQECPPYITMTF